MHRVSLQGRDPATAWWGVSGVTHGVGGTQKAAGQLTANVEVGDVGGGSKTVVLAEEGGG